MSDPFDAVLLVAFGGPQGPQDVRPFLENVLRGRRVSPARIDEVAHHYEIFGGVSPLTALTIEQARALEKRLQARDLPLPVFVGMRNWHPFLADTLAAMSRRGVRRAIGVLAAAQRSYSGCAQYKENVRDARAAATTGTGHDVDVVYVNDWHEHPSFIEAHADHVRAAYGALPPEVRDQARLVFTAHSIPISMAERYPYQRNLAATARLVANAVRRSDWALVYQSRSGRPEDPWLEPDVTDYLRSEHAKGLKAAVLCPIGFLCDHVEVLYDLDVEAADACRAIGLPMTRASAVNAHPGFIEALADAVIEVAERYRGRVPVGLGVYGGSETEGRRERRERDNITHGETEERRQH
jgi:ferrochelatase